MPSATTPVGSWVRCVSPESHDSGFPCQWRSAPHHTFRGLLSVHSRYGLSARGVAAATLCIEGFGRIVASPTAPNCYRLSDPLPGGICTH